MPTKRDQSIGLKTKVRSLRGMLPYCETTTVLLNKMSQLAFN